MKRAFILCAVLALAACGGGGTTSALPVAQSPSGVPFGTAGLLPSDSAVATAYLQCDSLTNIAAGNNCNNFANYDANTHAYALTAIAATSAGAPIVQQIVNGAAVPFSNGSYRVVEAASDVPAVVSVAEGAWSTPGSALRGAGGFYGNLVHVQCIRTGQATLQVQLVSASSLPLPLATSAFATNIASVNCTASGAIVII